MDTPHVSTAQNIDQYHPKRISHTYKPQLSTYKTYINKMINCSYLVVLVYNPK